ncbi:DUF3382 domain-containing protein [Escherichia coli]|nr:DUF3382 domain-containing protein [Escherichia coli]
MKPMHIAMALLSAAMFFVLAGVFMGVQLELDGTKLVVDSASDVRWQWVFIGTAVVFFFQLLRPAFQKGLKSVSGPKFILPAIDGSTVKQKLFLLSWRASLWACNWSWMAPNWWSTALRMSVGSGCLSARRWSFSSSFCDRLSRKG